MNRIEIVDLYKKIETLPSKNYNKFLLWSIMKTKSVLKTEIDNIVDKERILYAEPKFVEFEQKRIQIVQQFSEKNEDGTFKTENSQYIVAPELREELQNKMTELRAEYSEMLSEREKMFAEYNSYVAENIEVEIVKTAFENLPADMTPDEFEFLSKFVKED